MKISFKLIQNIAYGILILTLVLVAGTAAISALNVPGGVKLYNVQSGSMEPTIKTGSIVVVKPAENYAKDDIITFKSEEERTSLNPKHTITHRVYEVKTENGGLQYVTKGDANDAPDGGSVPFDLVLGKVIFAVPYIGYPIAFAKTQLGLIFLIIIPATLIVYSELLNIKREIRKFVENRKTQRQASGKIGQIVQGKSKAVEKIKELHK